MENAFGIMCSKFRVVSKAIPLAPEKVETVVMACCCLHNFLLRNPTTTVQYLPENPEPVCDLQPVGRQGGHRAGNEAIAVRLNFAKYFNSSAGAVAH